MVSVQIEKTKVRKDAYARRKAAFRLGEDGSAVQNIIRYVADHPEHRIIAGYMPIQTEIDPRPAMAELHALGHRICVPIIQGNGLPLRFREWTPESAMIEGDFGAMIPRSGEDLDPDLLLVPLVAFDNFGARLGYGGGYYDRTLELARQSRRITAMGFAFSAQEQDIIPTEPTDQTLDGVITEDGTRAFATVRA